MIAIFPKIAECAATGDIEKLVCMIREYFGGKSTYAPQVDLKTIYDNFGIPVTYSQLEARGAMLAKDDKGAFSIYVVLNQNLKDKAEAKFLLAHLLGHYLLHIQPKIARGEWSGPGYKETACPQSRYGNRVVDDRLSKDESLRDEEADLFAAALLLPVGLLRRALAKLQDHQKVADFFGITSLVLTRRLADIGLQNESPASFLAAEQRLEQPPTGKVYKRDEKVPGLASLQNQTSIEKPVTTGLSRALAKSSYAQNADAAEKTAARGDDTGAKPKKGLARIRDLARRIDSSVK